MGAVFIVCKFKTAYGQIVATSGYLMKDTRATKAVCSFMLAVVQSGKSPTPGARPNSLNAR